MERTFCLPWPPTANTIWRTAGRRTYLNAAYKEFLGLAGIMLAKQRGRKFTGPVRVEILLYPPRNFRFDIDNRVKPTLDALTKAAVWDDDSQVCELTVKRAEVQKPDGLAWVRVQSLSKQKESKK